MCQKYRRKQNKVTADETNIYIYTYTTTLLVVSQKIIFYSVTWTAVLQNDKSTMYS